MAGFFSRLKGGKDANAKTKKKGALQAVTNEERPKPKWEDAWTRKTVEPEEIHDLLQGCTSELKARALDLPFLILPFRPTSDPSAAKTFIRTFFEQHLRGEALLQELRLTEPMVLCSVVRWCWSRLAGGVVSWESYELFKVGEQDSNFARDAFATFIPLSVDSEARAGIIFHFFDLLSAIAAHAKSNGLGGRKLSRLAGWYAFEHVDIGNGFEGGYKKWSIAADAASHLFFAYLRSLSPDSVKGLNGISSLPRSLQALVQETEYPPERPSLLQQTTTRVVMIVDSVSPTPFSLLRRANHFQYRDDDPALQQFAEYEDPVKALTDECRRVLRSIATANQSQISSSKESTGLRDASWSRFEDIGFGFGGFEDDDPDDESAFIKRRPQGMRSTPHPRNVGLARPTTPSWADFLSVGFVDEKRNGPAPLLLPPDKILPPIDTRGKTSQSHRPRLETDQSLEPGELASITRFDLDDAFWWVWMSSLAGEETLERKAVFGRCALIETVIPRGKWLVMEEIVKGAAPDLEQGAYIAEKKSFWGRSKAKKNKPGVVRRKSTGKTPSADKETRHDSKTSIGPNQQARVHAAAIQLQEKHRQVEALQQLQQEGGRRGRNDVDAASQKTASVFTLQPLVASAASPAMKWANKYDKDAIREQYLGNIQSGRGLGEATMQTNGTNGSAYTSAHNSEVNLRPQAPLREPSRERSPMVPPKNPSPEPASLPPTPSAEQVPEPPNLAADVALPAEPSPIERKAVGSAPTSPRTAEPAPPAAPVQLAPPAPPTTSAPPAPPAARPSVDLTKTTTLSKTTTNTSAKLKKKDGPSGFRKLFGGGKSKEGKKPPPNASEAAMKNGAAAVAGGAALGGGAAIGRRFSGFKKKTPVTSPTAEAAPGVVSPLSPSEGSRTPVAGVSPAMRPSYEQSTRDTLSRVDTQDAHEAQQAFSSFDQGPLEDVPAFVAGSEDDAASIDDAIPPPISMSRGDSGNGPTPPDEEGISPTQDRWAQIRKNAAERAAQRQSEEQSRGGHSQPTDGDDGETSGEETIESRVARIKARVAELTGNMDGPPPRR